MRPSVTVSSAISMAVEMECCIRSESLQKGNAKYDLCVLGRDQMYEPCHICLLCVNVKEGRGETQRSKLLPLPDD